MIFYHIYRPSQIRKRKAAIPDQFWLASEQDFRTTLARFDVNMEWWMVIDINNKPKPVLAVNRRHQVNAISGASSCFMPIT